MDTIEFDFDDRDVLRAVPPDWARENFEEICSLFQVWMQMRVNGENLFLDRMTPTATRPLVVNLLDFALGWAWEIDYLIARGATRFDPEEYGSVIALTLLDRDVEIHSDLTNATQRVPLEAVQQSVRDLNERVRYLLIALDSNILDHQDLGPWFRGEVENIGPVT